MSSRVFTVWVNRGRDLLESSAAKTPKISMGRPAARRVTDVLWGDWRTERPWETRERTLLCVRWDGSNVLFQFYTCSRFILIKKA